MNQRKQIRNQTKTKRCNHSLRYPMIKYDKKELHEQTNMDKKVPLQDQFCYDTMLKSTRQCNLAKRLL